MRFILIFGLFCIVFPGWAQKIALTGKVSDTDTGEPLPYASVAIKDKPVGTIANLQGEFDFYFEAAYRNDILVISMLGYLDYEAPVWSLLTEQPLQIRLTKSITMLSEVVVTDSLDKGGEIFRIALSRIDYNYPRQPFLMDGFYRDVKKIAGTSIALLEAAVKIYDDNYTEPRNKNKLRERVKLVEVRKSIGYDNKFTSYFGQTNLLEDLLLHNNIRYRQIEADEEFFASLTRESDSYYNGHPTFVVSTTDQFFLKVYIDKTDYSIVHLEFAMENIGDNLGTRKNMVSKYLKHKKSLDFRRYEGRMYLNYITVTTNERWHDERTGELKFETELVQHLVINEIHANTKSRIGPTEKMRSYGLQYQDYPYNKEFWASYNVLKETSLDAKIREDLEKVAPLEQQFADE